MRIRPADDLDVNLAVRPKLSRPAVTVVTAGVNAFNEIGVDSQIVFACEQVAAPVGTKWSIGAIEVVEDAS